jgi:hypothetical protein
VNPAILPVVGINSPSTGIFSHEQANDQVSEDCAQLDQKPRLCAIQSVDQDSGLGIIRIWDRDDVAITDAEVEALIRDVKGIGCEPEGA